MTFIEIIDLFTLYGIDVMVLGIATCALTQILKTTILKKAPNKVYAFLPVIIGTVLYCTYAVLTHASFEYAFQNVAFLLDKGFTVGCAATIIYVVCEQFMRGESHAVPTAQKVVAAMIADIVDSQKVNAVSKEIADGFDGSDLQSEVTRIATLCSAAAGDAAPESCADLALLIADTLARIKTVKP